VPVAAAAVTLHAHTDVRTHRHAGMAEYAQQRIALARRSADELRALADGLGQAVLRTDTIGVADCAHAILTQVEAAQQQNSEVRWRQMARFCAAVASMSAVCLGHQ
jgi:glutathione S-transferase